MLVLGWNKHKYDDDLEDKKKKQMLKLKLYDWNKLNKSGKGICSLFVHKLLGNKQKYFSQSKQFEFIKFCNSDQNKLSKTNRRSMTTLPSASHSQNHPAKSSTAVKEVTEQILGFFSVWETSLCFIFTCSRVGLVAGPGDLGSLLHLVARLVTWRAVSAKSDHPTCETGQVTHLVLQQASFPLGYVGQTAAGLPHQVGLDRLEEK